MSGEPWTPGPRPTDIREKWNAAERAAWVNGASTDEVEAMALARIQGEAPQLPLDPDRLIFGKGGAEATETAGSKGDTPPPSRIQGEAPQPHIDLTPAVNYDESPGRIRGEAP